VEVSNEVSDECLRKRKKINEPVVFVNGLNLAFAY
jgi:hypothetical protein